MYHHPPLRITTIQWILLFSDNYLKFISNKERGVVLFQERTQICSSLKENLLLVGVVHSFLSKSMYISVIDTRFYLTGLIIISQGSRINRAFTYLNCSLRSDVLIPISSMAEHEFTCYISEELLKRITKLENPKEIHVLNLHYRKDTKQRIKVHLFLLLSSV